MSTLRQDEQREADLVGQGLEDGLDGRPDLDRHGVALHDVREDVWALREFNDGDEE